MARRGATLLVRVRPPLGWPQQKATLNCAVLSHSTMPQMSQVLRVHAIGMLTAVMSTRAVAREFNVHFSTISRLQRHFREFGSTSNRPHNRRPRVPTTAQDRVWRCVGERFADVNVVDRVAHSGGGVMVWAGVCYGQRTHVHFIDGILNAQRYLTRSWGPLLCHSSTTITSCCSMIMHGPMLQGSVHNSWKLKTSQFLYR